MDRSSIAETVKDYLSEHLNCAAADFDQDETVFTANDHQDAPFLELCTMGRGVIVSASGSILPKAEALMRDKNRDALFECPFIYGQSIHSVPDLKTLYRIPLDGQYQYEWLEGADIQALKGISGFDNSLDFDAHGNTPTCIVFFARTKHEIIGLAGASSEHGRLWELGVDVKREYRGCGLAASLISHLAASILDRGIVPFYCASVTNVASQAVAHRSGMIPCWVSSYRTVLDGSSPYDALTRTLSL